MALYVNNLTGSILLEMNNLQNLEHYLLGETRLSGYSPEAICPMESLEAHVADFGSARIVLRESSSNWSSFTGIFGYSAPAHQIELNDVLDQHHSPPMHQVAEKILSIAKLVFSCLQQNPQVRPSMKQVSEKLLLMVSSSSYVNKFSEWIQSL
ncbi:hypothetical protein FNV43_RR00756 [Rhamnella rubrinervis]|uniref:non-specific serine/threonine protein kinase n=1 Tax=Rhamnella rubrinervis TaxID=2594499 RepID=A0A8K0HQ62_9ROSA|nr:hypothetical protein FNV43_RR00756 [Rhamnella rubrinervis]